MTSENNHKYDDIIGLPHHVSATRPRMSMIDRAAQFSPFQALTGYGAAIQETGRLTDRKIELSEDERILLDMKQQILLDNIRECPDVSITYFIAGSHFAFLLHQYSSASMIVVIERSASVMISTRILPLS